MQNNSEYGINIGVQAIHLIKGCLILRGQEHSILLTKYQVKVIPHNYTYLYIIASQYITLANIVFITKKEKIIKTIKTSLMSF